MHAAAIVVLFFAVVVVSTAAEPIGMEEQIRNYYDKVMSGRAVTWDVELRRLPDLKLQQRIVRVHGEERSETPRGARICWLEIEDGKRNRELPVTLRVKPVERVPVTVTDVEPRTVLTPEMIVWQELPTEKYGAAHIATASDMQNCWTKVRIPAGTVVTGRRIEPTPRVIFGSPVKLVIRIGRIEATAEGKALEDGRIGEKIRVLNLVSGVRLRGRVAADGSVTVD